MTTPTPDEDHAQPATTKELFVLSQAVNKLVKLVVCCLVAIPLSLLVFLGGGAYFANRLNDQNQGGQHLQDCRGVINGGITNDQAQLAAHLGLAVVASNAKDAVGVSHEVVLIRFYAARLQDRVEKRADAILTCADSTDRPTDTTDQSPPAQPSPPPPPTTTEPH